MQNDRLANLFLSRRGGSITRRAGFIGHAPDAHNEGPAYAMVYCREHYMQLVVVSIPQQYSVISAARNLHVPGIDPGIVDAQLGPAVREDGCIWLDALPRLAAVYGQSRRDMFYRVDGHLTAEGNRVLGELVAATLIPRAWGVQPH